MNHYGEDYFKWHRNLSEFGAKANLFKFKRYIQSSDKVLDFGCGGGYLLKQINCAQRIGVEINPIAREEAVRNGIEVFSSLESVKDQWADVVISHHALEHTLNPYEVLVGLRSKLKPGGEFICVVPSEKKNKYKKDDINQHMYTWSEMNLGNLTAEAGFNIDGVFELKHKWPPYYKIIYKLFGFKVFHFTATIYGHLNSKISQVCIRAKNPDK